MSAEDSDAEFTPEQLQAWLEPIGFGTIRVSWFAARIASESERTPSAPSIPGRVVVTTIVLSAPAGPTGARRRVMR